MNKITLELADIELQMLQDIRNHLIKVQKDNVISDSELGKQSGH